MNHMNEAAVTKRPHFEAAVVAQMYYLQGNIHFAVSEMYVAEL
jgi:uncharacterized protein YlaN (UPF0358 family)